MSSKVFVGNLDFSTTREELETLFSQAGQIREVVVPVDRDTARPRGFAFVEFESEDDAARSIEQFNGQELKGRALRVNAAEDRPSGPRPFGNRPPFSGGRGGGGGGGGPFAAKPKGSRRNIRAKKRTL